ALRRFGLTITPITMRPSSLRRTVTMLRLSVIALRRNLSCWRPSTALPAAELERLGIRRQPKETRHHVQDKDHGLLVGAPRRRLREPATTDVYGQRAGQAKTRRERSARDDRFRKRRADLRMPCQKGSSRGIRMGVRGSRSRSLRRAWKQDRPTLCRPTLGIHRWQQDLGYGEGACRRARGRRHPLAAAYREVRRFGRLVQQGHEHTASEYRGWRGA